MFTRSHLQELKRRYASMYAPPVEEKVIEDGTIEGANQYKKDTPGQEIDKEFKEHCGVCGQGIEEDEIEEGTALQVKMALSDVGLKGTWKNNKVYVKKRDVKKAEKALKGNVIYRGKPPVVVGEEVEIDEGKFKKGDIVIPNMGPHKGEKHKIIHDFGDGSYNITPQKHPRFIKYKQGAAKAKENQLKLVKEEVEIDEAGISYTGDVKKKDDGPDAGDLRQRISTLKYGMGQATSPETKRDYAEKIKNAEEKLRNLNNPKKEEVELDEKGTAYPATVDTLRKIVKDKQHQTVMFKSGQAIVDLFTASAMVQVYDALKKPDMKKTFEKMITDKAGFMKTQAFAMKMIGK